MKLVIAFLALLIMILPSGAGAPIDDENCGICHASILKNLTTSLHYTGTGMMAEYEQGAAGFFEIDMPKLYEDKNCANCHVTTCGNCHGDEPHTNDISANIETCDVCHLKKQASFVGDMPMHKSEGPSADVHYELGFTCVDCHSSKDTHGDGTLYTNMLDAVNVKCEDCHEPINTEAHIVHGDKLDCSACHISWMTTCVNCHLDTMKTESIVTDKFYLARAADGEIKPFMQMNATLDGKTHTAYAEYFSHTITDEARDCEFCHENEEIFCSDGQLIGPEGASFMVKDIQGLHEPEPKHEHEPAPTPGFGFVIAITGLLTIVYFLRKWD